MKFRIPALLAALAAACSTPTPARFAASPSAPVLGTVEAEDAAQDLSGAGPTADEPGFLDDLLRTLGDGRVWLEARYRYEFVDDDAFGKNAYASTLRTNLGYETPEFHGFTGLLEFQNITAIGNDEYNSLLNDETDRPVVADAESTEVNQSYVQYSGIDDLTFRGGRQIISLDNQRFVGPVDWRQNDQTYDAASLKSEPLTGLELFYAYVANVNRVTGDDSNNGNAQGDMHLAHASYDTGQIGLATLYWYYLDFDNLVAVSTSTLGGRLAGDFDVSEKVGLDYVLEYAHQSDAGDNPNDIDEGYVLGQLGVNRGVFKVFGGYELLGGSGDVGESFSTPLATLHAFNGWADKFLGTPDDGLQDIYLKLKAAVREDTDVLVAFHDFDADHGSADYGSEVDVSVVHRISKPIVVGIKYANYFADDLFEDTQKAWVWISIKP